MVTKSFGVDLDPPPGTIVMWAGAIADIPAGWAHCDGTATTTNMLNRFPKGIPNTTTDPGTTGGQNSYSLATGQLPSHNHSGGTTNTAGKHDHVWVAHTFAYTGDKQSYYDTLLNTPTTDTNSGGAHSHGLNLNNTGSGNVIDNRPKSKQVCFIEKT